MENEKFEISQIIYCVKEGVYEKHLTKRNTYKLEKLGKGSKEGKVKIKNDSGKLVWIPVSYFELNMDQVFYTNLKEK